MLFGYRPALKSGNLWMAHHVGFTAKALREALVFAGFTQIEIKEGQTDLIAVAAVSMAPTALA
jgi:hypothetical protein